jgi:hypothetical protein
MARAYPFSTGIEWLLSRPKAGNKVSHVVGVRLHFVPFVLPR